MCWESSVLRCWCFWLWQLSPNPLIRACTAIQTTIAPKMGFDFAMFFFSFGLLFVLGVACEVPTRFFSYPPSYPLPFSMDSPQSRPARNMFAEVKDQRKSIPGGCWTPLITINDSKMLSSTSMFSTSNYLPVPVVVDRWIHENSSIVPVRGKLGLFWCCLFIVWRFGTNKMGAYWSDHQSIAITSSSSF